MGKDVFEDSKKRNNERENMSGRIIMVKWSRQLLKNYKAPTPKQLEILKIREQKLMKELYESNFHEITWDKKCV